MEKIKDWIKKIKDWIKNKRTNKIKDILKEAEIKDILKEVLKEVITDTSITQNVINNVNNVNCDGSFQDNYQTAEQKDRDHKISMLLEQYVVSYTNKVNTQKHCRRWLFIICLSIIVGFSASLVFILLKYVNFGFDSTSVDVTGVVSLVTICITFLSSILGLAQIITKYCFPENDEEYISQIVKVIQQNDFENKKMNQQNDLISKR